MTEPGRNRGVAQTQFRNEGAQRRLVCLTQRRADQVEPGRRVVDAAQDVEHLHQVVRCLVGRDLPHVEQVGPAVSLLSAGQRGGQLGVGLVALGVHVDQQRHHGGPAVAERLQLRLVERGVGDGEAALGGESGQLRASQRHLVGHRGLPVAQQLRRRDVVVVDELGLRARREDVVHRAPDRCLVQEPPVAPGTPELDHGPSLVLDVGGVAAVEDVRVDARSAQPVAQVQRVHPYGVTTGERRYDLVDPHGRAVYRRAPRPDCRPHAPIRPGRAGSIFGSCRIEPMSRATSLSCDGAARRCWRRSSCRWPSWCPPPCSARRPRRRPTSARPTGHPCRR